MLTHMTKSTSIVKVSTNVLAGHPDRWLAEHYQLHGDGFSACQINHDVAKEVGRMDHVLIWRIVMAVLESPKRVDSSRGMEKSQQQPPSFRGVLKRPSRAKHVDGPEHGDNGIHILRTV